MALTISHPTDDDIAFAKSRIKTDVLGMTVANTLGSGVLLFWLWVVYLVYSVMGGLKIAGYSYLYLLIGLPLLWAFFFFGERVFRDKHDTLASATEKWTLNGVIYSTTKRNAVVQNYMFELENGWTVSATKDVYSEERMLVQQTAKVGDTVVVELLIAPSIRSPLNKYPRFEVIRVIMA